MSNTWCLKELRGHVVCLGFDKAKEIIDISKSIGRATEIFDYHLVLARDAFKMFDAETDPNGTSFVKQLLRMDENDVIRDARIVSEANLIASINIMKSIFDSFGQLVNMLTLPTPLKGNVYLSRVATKVPDGSLKASLCFATSSEWFKYITAFINSAKHRQLVPHGASVSFVDQNRGGRLKEFTHNGVQYPSRWAREVLEGLIEIEKSLVHCGQALNAHLLASRSRIDDAPAIQGEAL